MAVAFHPAGPGPIASALRHTSVVLGGAVIALALTTGVTDLSATELLGWIAGTLGTTFLVLLGLLVFAALVAWIRLLQRHDRSDFWLETGLHAAGAIATLALTFTLLGISIGIGTLAQTELTPETVQSVIGKLTEQFSLAFLTSVIGLPLSTGFRALLLLTDSYINPLDPSAEEPEAEPVILTRHEEEPVEDRAEDPVAQAAEQPVEQPAEQPADRTAEQTVGKRAEKPNVHAPDLSPDWEDPNHETSTV